MCERGKENCETHPHVNTEIETEKRRNYISLVVYNIHICLLTVHRYHTRHVYNAQLLAAAVAE